MLDVNMIGVGAPSRPRCRRSSRRRGHVVVVASIYAFCNGVGALPYAMSKAAVEQLGRALRVELVQHGASASVAYFGFIDTEMVHQAIDRTRWPTRCSTRVPKVLHKRLPPAGPGEAIVAGSSAQPRIILPRRWAVLSVLRGILNPLTRRAWSATPRSRACSQKLDGRGP